jgi:hypothetical protein
MTMAVSPLRRSRRWRPAGISATSRDFAGIPKEELSENRHYGVHVDVARPVECPTD